MTSPMFYEDSLGAKMVDAWNKLGSADDALIEDPEALRAAQREVNGEDPEEIYSEVEPDWVAVFGPSKLSGLLDSAGSNACIITMPLNAAGIRYAWNPYPPEEMPGPAGSAAYHTLDHPFTLLVAPEDADEARRLISANPGSGHMIGAVASHGPESAAVSKRRSLAWMVLVMFIGVDLLVAGGYALFRLLRMLGYHL
jgi:hypothetical protein